MVDGAVAASVTENSAQLTWDAVDGVAHYEVRRAFGNDPAIETVAAGTTSYDFQWLATGRSALLEVRAVNASGESGPWSTVLAELAGVDTAGDNVAANPAPTATATATAITVTWETVAGNQGYNFYINEQYVAADIATGATSYTYSTGVVDLEPGTSYLIELRTKTASGSSERVPVVVTTAG